ncbi:hypothetical protein EI16_12205 [Hydrogenovibrio marinus]|uniref:Transglycosylase SLT domain-containing protein n=1 Tax=Hydrogenovibrio marinus TaxID=28885 RepID=A0A066ZX46_HYDMR|nr:hypothetical protein EI16_12205 [Hydrogenovibrio marinus]
MGALIEKCTPPSHWKVMKRLVQVESGGNPLAINVNAPGVQFPKPKNKYQAKQLLRELLSRGYSVDIGLAQINSQHFKQGRDFASRGFKAEDALDPCINLKMGALLISEAYRRHNDNLVAALSVYNTGNPEKGLENGYVEKYIPKK